VKSELVSKFGIDASRMETEGAGESKPVAPNDTPANKAMNRRVEFIRL
jgi:outer membrane protein OmpA-like peptidoglycan-associated protein